MATHLMITISNGTAKQTVQEHFGKYKTVELLGSGYVLFGEDHELHYLCNRTPVAKTLKKWLTTNKKKLSIKKVEMVSDQAYFKLFGGLNNVK